MVFQKIFRKLETLKIRRFWNSKEFSENRPGISENRQFSITSHERDDIC